MIQGASYVTLTLTSDLGLNKGHPWSKFSKKLKFYQPYRVVYQLKGLGSLIVNQTSIDVTQGQSF